MAKEKVCKKCKLLIEGDECPLCKGNSFATSWQGQINILDANKSEIAKKMDITVKGKYALKFR
ncbi:MAG: transcription elongation factor subunit Spt4 [archaeon]